MEPIRGQQLEISDVPLSRPPTPRQASGDDLRNALQPSDIEGTLFNKTRSIDELLNLPGVPPHVKTEMTDEEMYDLLHPGQVDPWRDWRPGQPLPPMPPSGIPVCGRPRQKPRKSPQGSSKAPSFRATSRRRRPDVHLRFLYVLYRGGDHFGQTETRASPGPKIGLALAPVRR